MDVPKPTATGGGLDHDPAASSMPRIPPPKSAGVPEVARDRRDEPSEVDALMRDVDRLAISERQVGALDALLRVARALRHAPAAEVSATLGALAMGGDHVPAVLRSLDALADRPPKDGDRP